MKAKGLVLLSGGLDSSLALGLMKKQNVELEAICCVSIFSDGFKQGSVGAGARHIANFFNVPLTYFHIDEDMMGIIKKPRYGHGSGINPCIDCHGLMFRKANEYMAKSGASFIVTGEVLGERPMSQLKQTIGLVEKLSGLSERIVRPLSGKLFPETIPEKEGILDRNYFLDFYGRGRTRQFKLAEELGITHYPNPAGGCILTDKNFAVRMRDALTYGYTGKKELLTLRWGRHFRISETSRVVMGRDEQENILLEKLADENDYVFTLDHGRGPVLIHKGALTDESIGISGALVRFFSKERSNDESKVTYRMKSDSASINTIHAVSIDEHSIELMRMGHR